VSKGETSENEMVAALVVALQRNKLGSDNQVLLQLARLTTESQMSCKDYLGSSNSTPTRSNQSLKQELLVQALSFLLNSTVQVSYMDPAQPVFPERIFGSDPCTVEDLKLPAT